MVQGDKVQLYGVIQRLPALKIEEYIILFLQDVISSNCIADGTGYG